MPDKSGKVKYLDDTQVEFIAECQSLLDDAKAGDLVGLTCVRMSSDYFLQSAQYGIIPADSSLIGTLAEMQGQVISNMSVERAINEVTEELDS